jgi:two-component system, chemotaxis family, protein-glutamate methylesterase/glutaminase
VVIGTSAGGLYAMSELLERLPANWSLPMIVVQHRSREQRGLLEEVLQSKSLLPVRQVDEKQPVTKGVIHIAAPDYHLLIESDKTFSLTIDAPVRYSRPSIDVTFASAALVWGPALIGIILTGANADGAEGIKAITAAGGFTVAQDPGEALFPAMPNAAIATGAVYEILRLDQIATILVKSGKP